MRGAPCTAAAAASASYIDCWSARRGGGGHAPVAGYHGRSYGPVAPGHGTDGRGPLTGQWRGREPG